MGIRSYIQKKYLMSDNAVVPIEFLADELLCSPKEARILAREHLNRKDYPHSIKFIDFTTIIENTV